MIRGLALRALTSLRLRSILEYVVAPLRGALNDSSGYVRQAAVMGVLKVFHLSPETIKDSDMTDVLYNMIRDREPQVVINAVVALNEILAGEGGIAINQAIIHHLLSRIKEFTDWGQCYVMELITKYTPANDDELFGIMNLLDPWLKVSNSAVVLATTKTFLALTASVPEIQRQIYLRLKTPLLTLMASSSNEIAYAVLSHTALVVERAPGVFDDEYKQFFSKFTEPSCVKSLKMSILPRIANPNNAREIVAELTEYVAGGDAELARQAVRSIGEIAVRVPSSAEMVTESLLELIEMEAEHVRAETVIVMQDVLRKYPDRAPSVIPSLHRCLKRMEDATGKAAVIWMIGEYGQLIDDAPYLLEPLIDNVKEEESVIVKCELLTATIKLFFKRPPEVQKMMGRLFKECLTEGTNALVHDRALLYFRLLRANVREASSIIGGDRPPVTDFLVEVAPEVREKIWSEFNTLSVVYGKPSEEFISTDHLIAAVPLDADGSHLQKSQIGQGDDDRLLSDDHDDEVSSSNNGGGVNSNTQQVPVPAPEVDLLGEDLLGLNSSYSSTSSNSNTGFGGLFGNSTPAPSAVVMVTLIPPTAPLEPAAFQGKWGMLATSHTGTLRASRVPSTAEVEGLARSGNILPIASGDVTAALKFYLYAQDSNSGYHLFEVVLDKSNGVVTVTIKSDIPGNAVRAFSGLGTALKPVLLG